MTRLIVCSLATVLFLPASAYSQMVATPSVPSRYAAQPQRPAAGTPGGYPVQPAAQQQPIRPQQPPGQPQIGQPPVPGQQPIAPAAPQQPAWVAQMPIEEQKWVDDVLRYWEARSDKVKVFECQFQRWDYDGGPVDADGTRHTRTYSQGVIKYAQPDKGLYRVEKLLATVAAPAGEKPKAVEQNPELGEHWICNGKEVFSFEASKKQVTVNPLPPGMQGQAIADGPLPFMFGAKAETIKARYWVRPLIAAPEDQTKQNRYWLEAVPKSRQDAQNFKMVRLTLDKNDYLPETLEIFSPHYDPPKNDARQKYVFSQRSTRDAANLADMLAKGLDPLNLLHREFHEVKIPFGWKRVDLNNGVAMPAAPAGPAGPGVRQAEQPAGPQRQALPVPR